MLNVLLIGTESVLQEPSSGPRWLKARTVQDAVGQLTDSERTLAETDKLPQRVLNTVLGESLFSHFLSPEPVSQCRLDPGLLLRHASGQLYQEAHLRLEREARQMSLPGLASDATTPGLLTKDVRFTPPSLARALAQQALDAVADLVAQNRPYP